MLTNQLDSKATDTKIRINSTSWWRPVWL